MALTDQNAALQVLGCLMKEPSLLAEVDKYKLETKDFTNRLHKIIFASIYNLFNSGVSKISEIEIDNYLSGASKDQKIFFDNQNGIVFLQDCLELSDLQNFNYYYGRIKKFSLLRELQNKGFDISEFYCEDSLNRDYDKINEKFDSCPLSYFIEEVRKKLVAIENDFINGKENSTQNAANGIQKLKESFKVAPDIGLPLQGEIYNTVVKGARFGKFLIRSSGTNTGKTRCAVGDACNLAYPLKYDWDRRAWIKTPWNNRVLFVTTEMDIDEIQTIILAWISGINEEVILNGTYGALEESILNKAISIMEDYKDNFIISHISDPSIEQLETCIRKNCLLNNCKYVFFDYIFSSPGLLNQFRDLKIRPDVVLCMMSSALKDLATELNIYIQSATQLSGDYEAKTGIRNQSFLRDAKSIADKADIGSIMVRIGKEELDIIMPIVQKLGKKVPNMVTDVYKVRRGQYKNVKIWSYVDLGCARWEDILITDGFYKPIENFKIYDIEQTIDEGGRIQF